MKTNVQNMTSHKGNDVPNQFEIITPEGRYFQSYQSIIAFIGNNGKVKIDAKYWDYSVTTGKYRNLFLGEKRKVTERKMKSGEYEVTNLNN